MSTLTLFRHAKSAWDDPEVADFDRPLAPRGEKAAPAMGQWMRDRDLRPDLVLSSPSARTRATCALALAGFAPALRIEFEDRLYLASGRALLSRIRRIGDEARHLMIVGHNPGLHDLAVELVGEGPASAREDLEGNLPTAAVAVIGFDLDSFARITPGSGRLLHFARPKQIMKLAAGKD